MKNSEGSQACGKAELINWLLMNCQLHEKGVSVHAAASDCSESCSAVLQPPHMARGR